MEIPDWSHKPLIQEGDDMDRDHQHQHQHHQQDCRCCSAGITADYHPDHPLIPHRRETRLLRLAQLLVAGLLLLTAGSLALLFAVGRPGQCAPGEEDQQVGSELSGRSLDAGGKPQMSKLQGGGERPYAMVTAPRTMAPHGKRLNWESKIGVLCKGGFNCTDSALLVPKDGVYRVFLQLTWRVDTACPRTSLSLKSEVVMFSDSYQLDKVVLAMVDNVECRAPWWKSLYSSRLVKLGPNSRLHVNSNFPELIALDENQVFFGAELID